MQLLLLIEGLQWNPVIKALAVKSPKGITGSAALTPSLDLRRRPLAVLVAVDDV
jgi:hypothetical protein